MKKITLLIVITIVNFSMFSQEITGDWYGNLEIQGTQLPLVFHISRSDSVYTSTMDSPKQGAKDIPVPITIIKNDSLIIKIPAGKVEYKGVLKNNKIVGTFHQGGRSLPLILSREENKKVRPQDPKKPYPYYIEDVIFKNTKANISLSGTLTLPKKEGAFPVVVLISGSGPQNRNEEMAGHRPFLVLSDYLTRNGIAVLRYDDRGVGESTGDFKSATTKDFATDTESAVAYLKTRKDIDKNHIGLIGHSEGGVIAPMVASNDKIIDFIVLLAGPGLSGNELLLSQTQAVSKAKGATEAQLKASFSNNDSLYNMAINSKSIDSLKANIAKFVNNMLDKSEASSKLTETQRNTYVNRLVGEVANPWVIWFLRHNPQPVLQNVECPVLAVNGEKDVQVLANVNLNGIESALKKGGNEAVTIIKYPSLNHLFQESKTGLPNEYETIEQTFSPKVLEDVTQWVLNQVK